MDYSSPQMSIRHTPSSCVLPFSAPALLQQTREQKAAQVDFQVSPSPCHPPNLSPSGPLAHELRVAFGTRYYDIHPDPHGLRGRGHHVVKAVVSFHTEGQRWIGTLEDHRERGGEFPLHQRKQTAPVVSFSSKTFVRTIEYMKVYFNN